LFELKSASLALVALILKTARLAELETQFVQRLGPATEFFNHDPVVVDLSLVTDAGADIDFAGLMALMRRYSMVPVAVRGGTPEQTAAALACGLCEAPPVVPPDPSRMAAAAEPAATRTSAMMVVDKPLRSGQQVYAKGADLVILALVSHGAEVIADGSIHVYAPLRGKAIAGATGDVNARIFATCMEPELISVAGIYQTTDPPLPVEVRGKSAQVRLDGETLVIEAIKA
jgi:septum site-determining protein MinC